MVNISGQSLTQAKQDELKLFKNVAFVNAVDNLLKLSELICSEFRAKLIVVPRKFQGTP